MQLTPIEGGSIGTWFGEALPTVIVAGVPENVSANPLMFV